jgi:immunoglobulin-binding protein 1
MYTESPTTFSTISTTDPNARRGAKIENFKLEKDLKKKLEVCHSLNIEGLMLKS